jgi:hypothetical protein
MMQNPVCTCYECRRHGCPCVERDADNQRLQQRVDELEAEIATLRSSADVERVAERIADRFMPTNDADARMIFVNGHKRHVQGWGRRSFKAEIRHTLQGESKGEGR